MSTVCRGVTPPPPPSPPSLPIIVSKYFSLYKTLLSPYDDGYQEVVVLSKNKPINQCLTNTLNQCLTNV